MSEILKPCDELPPLMRVAEHLAARPLNPGCDDPIKDVADWLGYSLMRCGLVIVDEALTRTDTQLREALVEARKYLKSNMYQDHESIIVQIDAALSTDQRLAALHPPCDGDARLLRLALELAREHCILNDVATPRVMEKIDEALASRLSPTDGVLREALIEARRVLSEHSGRLPAFMRPIEMIDKALASSPVEGE